MATIKRTKLNNTLRILREIWLARSISRVEIARKLKLNKSTVTHIVNELIDNGVVFQAEEGSPSPKGGRKPVFLNLNEKFGYVIGVELRPEAYTVVAVDLNGRIIFSKSEAMTINSQNFTDSFFEIMSRISDAKERISIPLLGIGVGVSGIVNPVKGIINNSIPMCISGGYDFNSEIASKFDIPVFIENDANCCSWGELVFHRTSNLKNFIFVLVEFRDISEKQETHEITSVGLGIVINGKVHYGEDFLAGEFRSILRSKSSRGQFSLSDDEINKLKTDKDILMKFFQELCRNLALLVNTFNLNQIFLGGDIERYRPEITEYLGNELRENWAYSYDMKREILFSSLGDKAVAFGAAGIVLNRLFVDFDIESDLNNRFLKESISS
ncbi:MAG: ROK family transcriptional regulator [Spirochaetes bacterium]|nr:MAG: ROK family transcriptional regulator [Spirochaetota bacterium]